jgi:anti-sigma factor (TIGR02949 family)
MSCRLVRRHLGAFVDGELDPTSLIEFERHLAVCAGCQQELAFERSFRGQVREALGGVQAPSSLRDRIRGALDAAPEPEPEAPEPSRGIRFRSWRSMRPRHAMPVALAAAALMALVGTGVLPGHEGGQSQVQTAHTSPMLEDVVRLHSSELPADVEGQRPEEVARYFRKKLHFRVRPAEFARRDVQLQGGRVSNVRGQRAAALYYDVRGRRVTVVVFDSPTPALQRDAMRVRLGGRDIFYRRLEDHVVPVRRQGGLNYAFTGDLDRESLLHLAASSRVRY